MRMPAKFMIVGAAAVVVTLGSVGALAIADDGPTQQRPSSSISVEQPLSEADSASNPPAGPQQPAPTRISDDRYDDWDDRNDDLDDRYDDDWDDRNDDWDDRDDDRDDLDDRSDDDDLDDDNDDRDDDNDRDD
ncbi:MAG: hypothetical protein QME72_13000 [Rhodococcus sp. (in: high G+C Gram-positive bacteria)]|nr:hypothetical protein [Rhodococcus sp. (in: high G+C Gram-positive bacteria)]MDI6628626.1 hypothetical protein [Rhodococcus sp. (in: high G+C Gram-positive bacteria)]